MLRMPLLFPTSFQSSYHKRILGQVWILYKKKSDKLLFLTGMNKMTVGTAGESREPQEDGFRGLRQTASPCSGQLPTTLSSGGHGEQNVEP